MKAVVSENGQVTIPEELRDRLGIRAGHVVDFDEVDGRLVVCTSGDVDSLEQMVAVVHLGMTTDEYIEMLRGPRDVQR
ncbi:MAG: AbrB/MazE/SpoVT family DNA-binding domain-containing protein [Dehalococcoidia bacterium]